MLDDTDLFEFAYSQASNADDLPWHRETLTPLLHAFLGDRQRSYDILDLGSGAGTMAVEMAERGHDVTGVDVTEKAVRMSRRRARERGVDVDFIRADVMKWKSDTNFDVVVDCGLGHGLDEASFRHHARRMASHVHDSGHLFLSHFAPRHRFDWRPFGPHRRSRETLVELMPASWQLETYAEETVHPPLPVGPRARYGHYWWSKRDEPSSEVV